MESDNSNATVKGRLALRLSRVTSKPEVMPPGWRIAPDNAKPSIWIFTFPITRPGLSREVCVRSFQVLQRLLQRLRWYVGQELVLPLPVWQESAQARVAQSLFLFLVAFDVESQTLVVDEAARTSELPQAAELFAVGLKCEFEGLQSQHVVGVLSVATSFCRGTRARLSGLKNSRFRLLSWRALLALPSPAL